MINKAAFSLLFQREKPPTTRDREKFERMVAAEGVELKGWRELVGGASPHASNSSPVLFKNNMIVAGSLAGVMEPFMNFGMLGAMVSGKIAAIATKDKGKAYEEFKKLTSFFSRSLLVKRMLDRLPPAARKAMWLSVTGMAARVPPERQNSGLRFVPGYGGFDRPVD